MKLKVSHSLVKRKLIFLFCAQLFGKTEPFAFPSPCGKKGSLKKRKWKWIPHQHPLQHRKHPLPHIFSIIVSLFSNIITLSIIIIVSTFFSSASSALSASTSSASRRTFPTVCSLTWLNFDFCFALQMLALNDYKKPKTTFSILILNQNTDFALICYSTKYLSASF